MTEKCAFVDGCPSVDALVKERDTANEALSLLRKEFINTMNLSADRIEAAEQERDQYKRELQTAMEVGADLVKGGLMPFKKQLRDLEAERDTLKEQLEDVKKCADLRQSILTGFQHDAFANLKRAESAEAEVKRLENELFLKESALKYWQSTGNESIKQLQAAEAKLAKAQEHIKVAEKFVRDEDWSDYLAALEEEALGGFESPSPATWIGRDKK